MGKLNQRKPAEFEGSVGEQSNQRWTCESRSILFFVLRVVDRAMTRTALSPKYQIVIPKEVRQALKLRPGTMFNVIEHEGRIELLPVRSAKEMRGFLRGINTTVRRHKDRV